MCHTIQPLAEHVAEDVFIWAQLAQCEPLLPDLFNCTLEILLTYVHY